MANKREQRLRRKARAKLAATVAASQKAVALLPIALSAIRYVGEIDAPNLRVPWSIDNRRRELVAVVHAHQGRAPERRAALVVPPVRQQTAEPVQRAPYRPVTRAATPAAGTRVDLLRDVDLKRRELRLAAQRFGAVANDRGHRMDAKPLAEAMEVAARALVRAEQRLADAAGDARRSA